MQAVGDVIVISVRQTGCLEQLVGIRGFVRVAVAAPPTHKAVAGPAAAVAAQAGLV